MGVKHLILVHDFTLLLFNITFAFGHTAGAKFLSTGIRKLVLDQSGSPVVPVVGMVLGIGRRLVTGMACLVQILVVINVDAWGFTDCERFGEFSPIPTLLLPSAHVSTSCSTTIAASSLVVFVAGPDLVRVDGVGSRASLVPLNQQTRNGQDCNSSNSDTNDNRNIRRR